MKVLFVATVMMHLKSFHLPYMKWFQEQGFEVHALANDDIDLPFCNKKYIVPMQRSPFKLNNILAYKRIKAILEKEKYNIIHCHTPVGGVLTRLAAHAVKKNKTKIIYTAHGFHFFKGAPMINWLLFFPIEKLLAHYTDILITINKEDYENAKRFKAKKVVYVPGVGIDINKFSNVNINIDEKRREIGISEKSIVLLSVGELSKRKNHEIIIKALSRIDNPNIVYLICGQGELDNYLKNLAKLLNVNVKFLGYRNDIPEICSIANIFVFPSLQEGLPVALMEAMASGLPVICSKIRGNVDLIEDGKGGYLVEPNNINGFVEAIRKIIEDRNVQREMGEYNRRNIIRFSITNVIEKMKKIYLEL